MTRQYNRREITPDDLKPTNPPPLDLSAATLNRPEEEILLVDKPLASTEAEAMAFAEEEVLIRLERNGNKYQPALIDVGVNGVKQWIPVGQPTKVKRKYLEVLLRAQSALVQTEHEGPEVARPRNLMHRFNSSRHPVSILRDPNPRGAEWAQRVAAES